MKPVPTPARRVSREEASLRQINAAIRLFHAGEFESAITLALAAEGQLPDTDAPYLYKQLKKRSPDEVAMFNEVRNWLKHSSGPDIIDIYEFEAVIALVRATSKFIAVHRKSTRRIENFIEWCRKQGYLSEL